VFRKNKKHQQSSLFDSQFLLPPKMRRQMKASWANTFYQEVFVRIPEEPFAVLYSEEDSRPNAPVNVLIGSDMLKAGFGWSDAELEENIQFDLLVRYALGMNNLNQEVPVLRTLYNFRRRVREYAQETGINLYQETFKAITDEQLTELELKTGWQRMDSTQLLSNIAQMSRLGLVLSVLQKGVSVLPAAENEKWNTDHETYLKPEPQNFCYRVKRDEVAGHLVQVGQLLLELVAVLTQYQASAEIIQLVERVLQDQLLLELVAVLTQYQASAEIIQLVERVLQDLYVTDDEKQVTMRPADEIPGDVLQSPHDPEATYRKKGGKGHKGYVANLSETCDPDNPVQLLTSVQLAPNATDDGQLLADSLAEQSGRGIRIDQITVDGGYTGGTGETACRDHQVQMLPTRIRGRRTASDRWGWEEYTWVLDNDDLPRRVVCPQGQVAMLETGRKGDWLLARFDRTACADCLFYQQQCRVRPNKHKPPTLFVSPRWIQVALLRQGMSPANNVLRAGVESTVRSFKHVFPAGKLPVRGVIRSVMVACCSALMVNCRRVHQYRQQQRQATPERAVIAVTAVPTGLFRPVSWGFWTKMCHFVSHLRAELLHGPYSNFLPQFI
jgi:uncharacterized protein YejL (UPF0352 family)